MLEKLRDNPRAVVAALIAAGVVAIAIGAGSQDSSTDTAQTEDATPEVVVQDEATATDEAADATAEEASESAALEAVPQEGPVEVASEEGVLKATVRSGDNQTVIVRQMVDDYVAANSEELSAEQRLFAETNLVGNLPKSDLIHPGEEVALEESVVASVVQMSKDLDEGQVALWSAYL